MNAGISEKLDRGVYERTSSLGASDVWAVFDKIVDSETKKSEPYVICNTCERIFRYEKGASPSNLRKHACYKKNKRPTEEIDEETKKKKHYKTATSERPKSKISVTELQQQTFFVEDVFIEKAREKEEYKLRRKRADELHAVKMATEKKLGELQVREMELRVEHLKKKQDLELEILMLQKEKEMQVLQQLLKE